MTETDDLDALRNLGEALEGAVRGVRWMSMSEAEGQAVSDYARERRR